MICPPWTRLVNESSSYPNAGPLFCVLPSPPAFPRNMNNWMRIGIFGGSFDPVHIGHLWIAESALESLQLNEIRWIPAATSPLKRHGPIASDQDRLQMLRLAVAGADQHIVDDREIVRGEISYTVDTVSAIREDFPAAEIFLVLGSDSLASFQKWHQASKLLELVTLAVVQRGGQPPIDFSSACRAGQRRSNRSLSIERDCDAGH